MYFLKKIEKSIRQTKLAVKVRALIKPLKKKKKAIPKADINYAYLAEDVLHLVKALNIPLFPMFGTLLSLYRDKGFNFADDYDFAVLDQRLLNAKLISGFEALGAELKSFSTVTSGGALIELSFLYKGVTIDVFYIERSASGSVHRCPNFRTAIADKSYSSSLKFYSYPSYFSVTYSAIDLIHDTVTGLKIPRDPESIFLTHYGDDWRTPKKENFIDYKHYVFHSEPSQTVFGKPKSLKKYLLKKYPHSFGVVSDE